MPTYIEPPFGYKWDDDKPLDADDVDALRETAMNMSDDPTFKAYMKEATKKELLKFFKDNGFTVYREKK